MTGGKQRPRARATLQRWIWFVHYQFQKPRLKLITIEEVEGRYLVVTPGVFNPVLGSFRRTSSSMKRSPKRTWSESR